MALAVNTTSIPEQGSDNGDLLVVDIINKNCSMLVDYLVTIPCIQKNAEVKPLLHQLRNVDYVLYYVENFFDRAVGDVEFENALKMLLGRYNINVDEFGFENFLYVKNVIRSVCNAYRKYAKPK